MSALRSMSGCLLLLASASARADVAVDLSGFREDSGVTARREGERLIIAWPMGDEDGRIVLDLRPGRPLIASLGRSSRDSRRDSPILKDVDPVTYVTVGSRVNPPDRPPSMSVFNVFFDSPAKRPRQQFRAKLEPTRARVTSRPGRASVSIDGVTAGPFSGRWELTVFAGSRLIRMETVVSTEEKDRAFFYDAGLIASDAPKAFAWFDAEGRFQRRSHPPDSPIAVRHRAVVAETEGGSIACFPPPHQFFYPRDYTDNQQTVWIGKNPRDLDDSRGFGVRQTESGGGSYSPWFNAPPGTEQRLGVFYLIDRGPAETTLENVLKFTHGDRFPDLPGRKTFTSHWHMAVTVAAMDEEAKGKDRSPRDFVKMFEAMNVNAVHLAEFHGDGHPQDPGPLRLPEMAAMFAECRRLSDDHTLFLPGEEANANLTTGRPGQHTGHWLYLFPRPVSWTMARKPGQPFEEIDPTFGKVYHVGSRDDVFRLLETEHGLAWTAHARIKASNWTPDAYKDEEFFRSPVWLGAAWKAMPADLSLGRLGERALDLLDDMANWGAKKYVLGEVDVFKIDHSHELYGHMNVNYLKLDRMPKFDEDWSPVLDALRRGKFFVTTGEVLLTEFTVGGKESGETLERSESRELRVSLEWTFPMSFAEVVSGDGSKVYRERIDLSDTPAFGKKTWTLRPDLAKRNWVRIEAWDVAANGAFSEPVWLKSGGR